MACMGKRRRAFKVFMGKHDGKKHFEDLAADGRILMDLQEVVRESMDWINVA